MDSVRAWKDPEYRRELGSDSSENPAGLVALDDDSIVGITGGTGWACVITGGTIAATLTICSPTGTLCGSCSMGTSGCCH